MKGYSLVIFGFIWLYKKKVCCICYVLHQVEASLRCSELFFLFSFSHIIIKKSLLLLDILLRLSNVFQHMYKSSVIKDIFQSLFLYLCLLLIHSLSLSLALSLSRSLAFSFSPSEYFFYNIKIMTVYFLTHNKTRSLIKKKSG